MVMVHGITTYSFLWKDLLPALSEDFEVITLDLLGCGDSDKPHGADYSLPAQADIITKLLDSLGIRQAHFVTHDVGGGIGQIIAIKHPEYVKSLVLINSVGYDYWPVQPIISLRIPIIRQIAMAAMDMGILKLLIKWGFYHKEKVTTDLMSRYQRPLLAHAGREGFLALAKGLNNRHLMDIADGLRHLTIPVLIIRGDADVYLPAKISERLHNDMKDSRYEVITRAGHFAPLDEPRGIVGLIEEFLGVPEKANEHS
jgi:pimeloyl-ACP methyl ester carboxylesterase